MTKNKRELKRSQAQRPWQLFLGVALICLITGCAVKSKQLLVKELTQSFVEGTIISSPTGRPVSFDRLLADLKECRVIYVGESHANPSHHEIELAIIDAVFKEDPRVAVGMEMFDHTYQKVLDSWSAGRLDRKSFLRKTHWYANWRYDYALYGDILDYIKNNQIRLVGLNIPFHIPPKLRVGGLENLSAADKRHLPEEIDTSIRPHREFAEKIFKQHNFEGRDEFDDFYLVQCVWDDAMAEAIALNLKDAKMIVLAGSGHIQFKYGVPDRAYRRSGAPFRTIYLASVGQEIELAIADYIWVTP
ncbi:MAG: ChaN family lipoprotein [Desulfobacterales bacterium]|nr:MAG: ChaN family lipoprotein [Desulfobacterales bacterium]